MSEETSLPKNVHVISCNDQVKALQTSLREKDTSRGDFIFCADRLSRLAVEEGLNLLPFTECTVTCPTGAQYQGVKFSKEICGVSLVRSGEAMELALRDCCQSIRIGKLLIKRKDNETKPSVFYAKLPPDVDRRFVFLMHPLLDTGETLLKAVALLKEHGVAEKAIIILTLFATPGGVQTVTSSHPELHLLTTEVYKSCPSHFGQVYFGTS